MSKNSFSEIVVTPLDETILSQFEFWDVLFSTFLSNKSIVVLWGI